MHRGREDRGIPFQGLRARGCCRAKDLGLGAGATVLRGEGIGCLDGRLGCACGLGFKD